MTTCKDQVAADQIAARTILGNPPRTKTPRSGKKPRCGRKYYQLATPQKQKITKRTHFRVTSSRWDANGHALVARPAAPSR
jgi:hypothetical protein